MPLFSYGTIFESVDAFSLLFLSVLKHCIVLEFSSVPFNFLRSNEKAVALS